VGRRRQVFSEFWVLLATLFAAVAIVSRREVLLAAPLLFLTVFGAARLWDRRVFHGVFYYRRFTPRRAFVGETVELTVEVENRKFLPVGWLCLTDQLPDGLLRSDREVSDDEEATPNELHEVFALRWYERLRKRYQIQCQVRGCFRLGPAYFSAGDVFGISKSRARDPNMDWLIVYPNVYPIEALGLPSTDPFGDAKARQRMFEDPLRVVGVRDYRHGDGFRRIHWKATARRQQLQSKVYEPAASHSLMLCLNIATLGQPWRGTIPEVLEHLVSVTASLAQYAIEQRYAVGVLVNSSVPNSKQAIKVPPGRSPQQLTRLLEALAVVTPLATSSIEQLLTVESPRLPQGATLVLATAAVSESLAATLLHLSRAGRQVVVITLARSLPDPLLYQHVLVYHLPPGGFTLSVAAPSDAEAETA